VKNNESSKIFSKKNIAKCFATNNANSRTFTASSDKDQQGQATV